MSDQVFSSHWPDVKDPALSAVSIAPSDSADLAELPRAIYVGGAAICAASSSTTTWR
mgnify:CR=1 FL=1